MTHHYCALKAWGKLVERYADGRMICNCGHAYYSLDGEAWVGGRTINNHPHCKYGCSANAYRTKEEIAKRMLAELGEYV